MKSKEYRNTQILANLVCGILALLALLPFILLIVASLTDNTWATANGFSFFPGSWSLDAYRYIAVQWATIGRAYLMTIVVTIIGTAASIMVTTLFAYAICQQEVPGMKLLSFMMVFTMLFNGGLVATYYSYVNYFHVRNTIWALIVPNLLMNAFNVILVRNYFTNSIPASLIEAGKTGRSSESAFSSDCDALKPAHPRHYRPDDSSGLLERLAERYVLSDRARRRPVLYDSDRSEQHQRKHQRPAAECFRNRKHEHSDAQHHCPYGDRNRRHPAHSSDLSVFPEILCQRYYAGRRKRVIYIRRKITYEI